MKRVASCFIVLMCCCILTCGVAQANKTAQSEATVEQTEKQEDKKNIFQAIGDFFQRLKDDVSKGFKAKNESGTLTVPRTDITDTRPRR